jgi:hypothetical protein
MGPREVEKEACTDRGQTPLGATLLGLLCPRRLSKAVR